MREGLFEKWLSRYCYEHKCCAPNEYEAMALAAYAEGRRQGLEEAAKLAESGDLPKLFPEQWGLYMRDKLNLEELIAEAIRSLIGEKP